MAMLTAIRGPRLVSSGEPLRADPARPRNRRMRGGSRWRHVRCSSPAELRVRTRAEGSGGALYEVHHIAEIAASRPAAHVRTTGSVWRPFCSAMHDSQMTPNATITAAAISNSGRAAMLTARRGLPPFQSFLPVGLCVDESVPTSAPLLSIPVSFAAGLGLGLCVELVLPMPGAVGSPPTPFVDGAAVSAARHKPLAPIKRARATAAVPILRCIALSL